MQFLIGRDVFAEALGRAASVVPGKTSIPALQHVLIDAGASGIRIRATDCEIEAAIPAPAEVQEGGIATADGKLLNDIVRKCPPGAQVSVTHDKVAGKLRIACGRAKFVLSTLAADDWPALQAAEGDHLGTFEIASDVLRSLLEKTRFAICADETRYYLNGIYLHVRDERLIATATDGHRLSVKSVERPAGCEGLAGRPGVIVPRETVSEMLKILPDSPVAVEVAISERLIRARIDELEITSKLLDGTYPDYERVIPHTRDGLAIAPREALQKAAARVSTVLDERSGAIGVSFEDSSIVLRAHSRERGDEGSEAVDGCTHDGAPVTVGVNARNLADILGATEAGQITIAHRGPDAPLLFEEVDGDGSHRMVLMPVRI